MAIKEIQNLAEVVINDTTSIFVTLSETAPGRFAVDVRRWFIGDDEEWHPTSKGIYMPASALDDITKAIKEGDAAIKKLAKPAVSGSTTRKRPAKKAVAAPAKKAASRRPQRG